jgi:hypothetical protein
VRSDDVEVARGKILQLWDSAVEPDEYTAAIKEIDTFLAARDAKIRAKALNDAADRAVEYLKGWDVGTYLGYDDLRADILKED